MTRLERYNQVLWATVGTVGLVGVVALVVCVGAGVWRKPEGGLAIPKAEETVRHPQHLVFCAPSFVNNSEFQYFPVAVVSSEDASRTPALLMASGGIYDRGGYLSGCGLNYATDNSRIFNVVIRNTKTGGQSLLLDVPGQIESLRLPDQRCAEGVGEAPCGVLLWGIRKSDSNGDGLLNGQDALVSYVSDTSAGNLRPVTPPDATVLATSWNARSGEILFQVRHDTNKDGKFTAEDGAEVLITSPTDSGPAKVVINESLIKSLQGALQ